MRFKLGSSLSSDESRQLEFKAISSQNPVRAIADVCDAYAVAFLNSSGGKILWGVRDSDKVVTGVALSSQQRDELRRVITDKLNSIEPRIDPTLFRLEIFPLGMGLFVVSLSVPRVAHRGPFYASGKYAFVRLDGANKLLSGPQLTAWITRRTNKPRKKTPQEPAAIEVYYEGKKLSVAHEVLWDFRTWTNVRPSISVDFHFPPSASESKKAKFGIVTSSFFTILTDGSNGRHKPIALPDGRHLFTADKMMLNLMPGGWYTYSFTGEFREHVVNRREEMAFRFFTANGPSDVPFAVRMLGVDTNIATREEHLTLKRVEQSEHRILERIRRSPVRHKARRP